VNCVLAYTSAMTHFALKALLLPELPNNEGVFRPIGVHAPEGSILNPRFPAAVGGRAATGHYVPPLIFGALAEILPDKVRAAPGSPLWIMNIAGTDEAGRSFANVLFFNGGTGAGAGQGGVDAISWPSNISATPVEVAERTAPVLIHHKKLRPGSGGAGRHLGGRGQEMLIESEAANVATVFVAERLRFAAPGLFGGSPGAPGRGADRRCAGGHAPPADAAEGSRVTIRTPGGGGYGRHEETGWLRTHLARHHHRRAEAQRDPPRHLRADNVLRPLIGAIEADDFFTAFPTRARRRRSASCPAPGWAGCAASC
jgi:N-methylhydantoinase B